MPFSASARRSKLAATLVLCCLGLLFASTAATVLAAGESQRRVAASMSNVGSDAASDTQSIDAISHLVDSLVEPLFFAGSTGVGARHTVGNPTVRNMLDLLTADSANMSGWDQYTTVQELLTGLRMPKNRLHAFELLWHTNMRDADSALLHGQPAEAIRRARENIAAARWVLLMPSTSDARIGRDLLAGGAKLLARSALQDDQPFLNTAAERLTELAQRARVSLSTEHAPASHWGANIDEAALLAIADNRTLLPAARVASLTAALTGTCLREREVLFGPSRKRVRSMMALGLAIRDLPNGDRLAAIHRESLMRLERPSASVREEANDPADWAATITRFMIPSTVRARVQLCRTIA